MNTSELQESIIQKIRLTKDEDVISVYKTTEEQKVSILEGREQIAKGNYFTNEQVEKEIDEWLSK